MMEVDHAGSGPFGLRWLRRLPLALTTLRALLAPVLLLLALRHGPRAAFGICLTVAFLSDVFDGIVARRLNIATAGLRRYDSMADTAFYVAALFAAWYLHADLITRHRASLAILIGLEFVRYGVDWLRFRREAAYHLWLSKLWGVALFTGYFSVLVFGAGGWPVSLAIYVGIFADLEGLAVSFVLSEWRADVPTIVHAFRLRSAGTA
jgi:CDP-diacylglycerol--glycerol-3-phosphate 3-phosphatidyltransferase